MTVFVPTIKRSTRVASFVGTEVIFSGWRYTPAITITAKRIARAEKKSTNGECFRIAESRFFPGVNIEIARLRNSRDISIKIEKKSILFFFVEDDIKDMGRQYGLLF